jgi:hypothetical protein
MPKSYPTIALSEIDEESPVNETIVDKFFDRQESLISGAVDCRWPQNNHNGGAFSSIGTARPFIPAAVTTTTGSVVSLRVVFEAYLTGSATQGEVQIRLAGGTWVTVVVTATGSFARHEALIAAADVEAAADSEALLEIQARVTAGSGAVEVRNQWGASRLERAA